MKIGKIKIADLEDFDGSKNRVYCAIINDKFRINTKTVMSYHGKHLTEEEFIEWLIDNKESIEEELKDLEELHKHRKK